jgi:polyisoprenoid-binding protein YceI
MAVNLTACANIMAKVLPSNHQTLDAEKFPGGTYKMDMSHTNLSFSISHMGFSNYIGRFNKLEGMLIFDPAKADTPNISLTVDINSIDTNHRGLEEQLRGKGFFNAEKYPTATFIGTSLNITDPANGILIGEFTLMGVTKTVQFDIHFKGGAKHPMGGHFVLGFEATTTIKRSEFSFKALIPMIGDDVKLTFNGEFHRTGD